MQIFHFFGAQRKNNIFCDKTKKYSILTFRDKTAANFEVIVMLPNILSYTTAIYASLQY